MQESLEVMKTALRVLTALTEKCQPSPLDVDMLRRSASPQPTGLSLEQLACDVIQKSLGQRIAERASPARQPSLMRKLLQALALVGSTTTAAQRPGNPYQEQPFLP
jgi:hypothetical protein